ncbi:hypothetical protein TWF694_000901 [Orbilia ellipsospora]|uniref:MPN domain-containing protein n=1 Tax=Orbilia ellipsospora TaxID=2528407 RepID=A0AAV9XRJ0_9PEZI
MSRAVFHGSSAGPPVASKDISKRALDYEYSDQVPLSTWLRTAATLLREADVYFNEGNEEQAFLLYMRHMDLIVTHLPSHPQARETRYERQLVEMNTKFPAIASRMEKLKGSINGRYEAYTRERQRQMQKEHEEQQAVLRQHRRSRGSSISSSNGSTSAYGYGQMADGRSSYLSDQQSSRGRPGELEKMGRRLSMQTSDEEFDLQKRLQELQLRTQTPIPLALQAGRAAKEKEDKEKDRERESKEKFKNPRPMSLQYPPLAEGKARMEYPIVPKRTPFTPIQTQLPSLDDFANPSKLEQYRQSIERMPIVPPKIKDEYDPNYIPPQMTAPPPRPIKERAMSSSSMSAAGFQVAKPNTNMDPPEKPKRNDTNHIFDCVAYTEGGKSLRTIFIPRDLRRNFLAIAAPNTKRNLETCGILAGFLRNNAFFVNRLVIPQQEATSDTCNMMDESSLFDYIDSEDLMVLGWIHTHPTQTCFMSSVDLHTHCGYQMMLRESIAIVCAPSSQPSWGVFRLTDPDGVRAIKNCNNTGLFHPHSSPHVYTDALRPGHVCEVDKLQFKIHDLRS